MLNADHWNILRALMNRIIPQDDFPNAWDAGVGNYLSQQFERDLQHQVETYRLGLEALDGESQASTGKGFPELDTSTQDVLLSRMETGQVTLSWPVNPTEFFDMVIEHVMEGYYSDPGNGGNRDSIAWKMIGFESHE
jgi:Gluconate 2-dehydrogenase subunit 3